MKGEKQTEKIEVAAPILFENKKPTLSPIIPENDLSDESDFTDMSD